MLTVKDIYILNDNNIIIALYRNKWWYLIIIILFHKVAVYYVKHYLNIWNVIWLPIPMLQGSNKVFLVARGHFHLKVLSTEPIYSI